MITLLISHPACLAHDMGEGHPEQPDRLRAIDRGGQVQPSVQRRNRPFSEIADDRVVQNVEMEMQNVEFVGDRAHFVEHDDVVRNGIPDARI